MAAAAKTACTTPECLLVREEQGTRTHDSFQDSLLMMCTCIAMLDQQGVRQRPGWLFFTGRLATSTACKTYNTSLC